LSANDIDGVAGFVAHAAELDPAIRDRVVRLANLALSEAEYLIQHGDPRLKASIISKFMTILAKEMNVKAQDEEMEAVKRSLADLRQAFMDRDGMVGEVDTSGGAVKDTPEVDNGSI
jgi:hypothetical protein